ncbi:uncharacterized protein N7443_006347 [Penicillium atrosanguineum]|uniref:Uncharacterized protein n=1 Tax=Penicillium atrosanguineum TaxID=1132637 RepID=A0A9W9U631_9EURO|nr:uncharacterized protein N7443_006347 [Penicillium atrosanguineum]KAJ5298227.1 hypothetical protein N7443_006347 [Penicillium atrosanguineum]KAJ5321506.1 hypothetical protein N7476_004508 [Penicillium atrosanguineum]
MFCDESFVLETFIREDNDLQRRDRFVVIYDTVPELGSHCLGVVYGQKLYRAAFPMTLENLDSVEPVEDHENMWFPLETILTNWIYMFHIGKITAGPWGDEDFDHVAMYRSEIGIWFCHPYRPAQVDNTVAAMDRYSAAIESRMTP